jgi:hypothetical protein
VMGGPVIRCHTPDGTPDSGDTAWMMAATTLVFLQTPAIGVLQGASFDFNSILYKS